MSTAALAGFLRELTDFLRTRFGETELRELARDHLGPDAASDEPGSTASRAARAQWLADALWIHGAIDDALFSDLEVRRSRLGATIRSLRASWAKCSHEPARGDTTTQTASTAEATPLQRGGVFVTGPATINVHGDLVAGDKHVNQGDPGERPASRSSAPTGRERVQIYRTLTALAPTQFDELLLILGMDTSPHIPPAPAELATRAGALLRLVERDPTRLSALRDALEVGDS
ncbi:MAG: hypothetical protein R3A51_12530 [Nannocystaceae bacterium]|nr:hypothetical protein [Myxococcales bacterium]